MVQRAGFEPAKHYALGPHPSPFDRSGTSACESTRLAGIFHRYPNFQNTMYAIGTIGKQIAKTLLKALQRLPSSPSGILSATATTNSSMMSAPGEPELEDNESPQKRIPTFSAIGGA